MNERVMAWPRLGKQLTVMVMDVALALFATWVAFTLRLDTPHWPAGAQWYVYVLAPALALPVFIRFGLYRAIFRYTGLAALMTITQAVLLYGVALFAILLWQRWLGVPRTIGLLQPIIFLLLVGGSRALARFWLADIGGRRIASEGRLLIYGAGAAGVQTAAAIANAHQFVLVGFVDDDAAKSGRSINGVTVHRPDQIADLVERRGVTDILLALPSASRGRRNEIIASLRSLPVHIRSLPGMSDLASGRVTVRDFNELDIEDLLGRDAVAADPTVLARNIAGHVILVTGAGGSIGSELCRQILRERPRQLILLDHNEFGLYSIHQELLALCAVMHPPVAIVPLLGSVSNMRRLQEVCVSYRPHCVYHAAAYKHVPMVESNPSEGMANNVFGTLNVARAALAAGVANFVLVSTDKAVRPTNIMGASKRMAELVLQALAAESGNAGTRFCMVRFGNVLGSSGSVVPLFRAQLASGGPLTVTHPEVTRYFMTIPEAAQLVLHAGAMAVGGEVFVLDMGEPVKIMDLAHRMIQLSGLKVKDDASPEGDIAIAITGLRPGEKLFEELLIGDNPSATAHTRIMKAHEEFFPWLELDAQLHVLREAVDASDVVAIKSVLQTCVHGYAQRVETTW
ncbi:MAG: polysaccharide biosynthesis protein [Rhodoferax sp.]|nr:polysaccharide biosynthesis protein [Rhodoferax sp.]